MPTPVRIAAPLLLASAAAAAGAPALAPGRWVTEAGWNAVPDCALPGVILPCGATDKRTAVACQQSCEVEKTCTQWTWNYGHAPNYFCFTSNSTVWGGLANGHIVSGCLADKVKGCGTRPPHPPPEPPPVPPWPPGPPPPRTPHWVVKGAPATGKSLCGFKMAKGTQTTVVYRATEELGAYNHAAMMDFHDGNLFLTWKNSPRDEDSPGQRVLYAQSSDGVTWTRTDGTNVLFPNMTSASAASAAARTTRRDDEGRGAAVGLGRSPKTAALFGGPTVVLNGRRYASASPHQFALWPYPYASSLTAAEDTNVLLLREVVAESREPGVPPAARPRLILGQIFWASAEIPRGFEEASRRNNVTTSTRMGPETQRDMALLANISQLPCATGAAAGTLKCEACRNGCGNTTRCERAHYVLPDGSGDVILERGHKHAFTFSRRDAGGGGEWGPNLPTDIPDVDANLNAGTLPDGRIYLVSNACPVNGQGHGRDPLTVSTSVDGFAFSQSWAVMGCEQLGQCGPRIAGGAKGPGPSYPQAVTVTAPASMAGLWVVATNNKEDVVVTRVPFSSLQE